MARRTPKSRLEIDPVPKARELLAQEPRLPYTEIAARAGCSVSRVSQIAARYGYARTVGRQRPAVLRSLVLQLDAEGLRPFEMIPILSEDLGRPVHRQEVERALKLNKEPT
jgi:hypothetical protein